MHQDAKTCYICKNRFLKKFPNAKNYRQVKGHCHFTGKYRGAAHSICNLRLDVPNEIPVVSHNGSNYDYHFIIKKIANEFEGKFEYLGKNTEKHKNFSAPIQKEVTNIDKDGNESVVTISYRLKFIVKARFMVTSLSNLVDNLTDGIHITKCKDCDWFLNIKVLRTI